MADHEIVRLGANDLEEALRVMDVSFDKVGTGAEFDKILPKMKHGTQEMMEQHLAVRRDGALRAILGVFRLIAVLAGVRVLFTTTGNVGTLPEERGKGYMTALLNAAMEENARIGAAASRLSSGHPSRYQRFGFFHCGINRHYKLTADLMTAAERREAAGYVFRRIEEGETKVYADLRRILEAQPFYVERATDRDFYDTMCAWQNVPYVVTDGDGKTLGFLAAKGNEIAELYTTSASLFVSIALAKAQLNGAPTGIPVLAHQTDEAAILDGRHAPYSETHASMFRIMSWTDVLRGSLALAAAVRPMKDFRFTVKITGIDTPECAGCDSGTFKIAYENGKPSVTRTDAPADVMIPYEDAGMFFFGRAGQKIERSDRLPFPLPFSWNLQDRV